MTTIRSFIPITWFLTSSAFAAWALNSPQRQRFILSPLVIISAVLSFCTLQHLTWPLGLNSIWGLGVSVWTLHITALLYTKDSLSQSLGHIQPRADINWRRTYKLWTNTRLLTVPIPQIAPIKRIHQQSRLRFAAFMVLRIAMSVAVDQLVVTRALQAMHLHLLDFAAVRETYIRRVLQGYTIASHDTQVRAFFSVHWIWSAYFLINTAHHILAFFFVVVLRLDQPDEWPPLFGSPLEAYTVQRFWGKFWHRLAYRPYLACAGICSHHILKTPRGSRSEKLVETFFIFLLSGVTHSLVAWQLSDRCGKTRDIFFFMANFLAGALEMVLSKTTQSFAARYRLTKYLNHSITILLKRMFGYLWVWLFFAWIIPKWHYPKVYCALQDFYQT